MPSKTKIITGSLCLLLLGWFCISVDAPVLGIATAHAQGPSEITVTVISTILAFFITILNFLTYLVLHLLEFLLDPSFIMDINSSLKGAGGEELLLIVWRVSRDIVNVIFAFLLIVGAIATVVMARGDIIQPYIVKFIIAIVLVNFSWFFPRVVIDVANVLTATVYQLPGMAGSECKTQDIKGGELKPCKGIVAYKFFQKTCPDGFEDPMGTVAGEHLICVQYSDLSDRANTPFGVLHGLVVNHARLSQIPKIANPAGPNAPAGIRDQLQEIIVFLVQTVFTLFLHIALLFPLIALAIVFFLRIPILWVTIAFMPFMFLGYVIGDKLGKANTMDLIWGHFWKAAFVPTVVAVPFAIGFIMVNAASTAAPPAAFANLADPNGFLISTVSDFWALLWLIMAFIIIWSGVFMALQIDEVYNRVGGSVKAIGESWGKFVGQLPLAIPTFPVIGGKLDTLRTLKRPEALLPAISRMKEGDRFRDLLGGPKPSAAPDKVTNAANNIGADPNKTNNLKADINIVNTTALDNDPGIAQALGRIKKALSDTGQFTPAELDDEANLKTVLNKLKTQLRDNAFDVAAGSNLERRINSDFRRARAP